MKTKINYRSKKTIVIIAIIAALIVVASIGTVVYIKGNRKAAAATEEKINTETEKQVTDEESDGSVNESELPLLGDNNQDSDETDTNNNNNITTTVTNNNNTTNNNSSVNQEYVQTTTETIENPWETSTSSWSQLTKKDVVSESLLKDELEISKPNLEIKKYAYMENDLTKSNTATQLGEKITYVIEVKNTSEIDAKDIYVYDNVPEGTTLVKDSIDTNVAKIEGNTICWKIDLPAYEEKKLSFDVEVEKILEKGIKNVAFVDGEETNSTETAIIESNKKAEVIDNSGNIVEQRTYAKVGEKIKYTITANNETNIDGKTTITDTVPAGTVLDEDSVSDDADIIVNNGVTTLKWENIDVEANRKKEVSFEVTVKDVSKEIKNTAKVGNTDTDETTTKVANIKTVKTSSASNVIIHENDTITYTLTLTNSGDAEGTVEVSDVVPEGTRLVNAKDATTSTDEATQRTKLTWTVTVPAGKFKTVSFEVKVNPFNDAKEKKIVNDKVMQDGSSVDTKTEDKVEKEYFSLEVKKEFEDFENIDKVRPSTVTIGLYTNESTEPIKTCQLSKVDNNWSHTFSRLDKYGIDSKELLTYEVKEISMGNAKAEYSATVTPEKVTANQTEAKVEILNKVKPETIKTNITVKKEWKNSQISTAKIPDSIDIVLTGNIQKKLYKNKNWTDTFEVVKYTTNGTVIDYKAEEKKVQDYVEISNIKSNNTITIVNALPSLSTVKKIVGINGNDVSNMSTPLTVEAGDVIKYKITVTNGLVDLNNVIVKDEMTNNKTVYKKYENNVVSEVILNNQVDVIETFKANEEKTYFVYYKVDELDAKKATNTITNTAHAEAKYKDNNGEEKDADHDYSEITVQIKEKPVLEINKKSNKKDVEVVPEDKIEYTITVLNKGNVKQTNVIVTDVMNDGRVANINSSVVIKGENNSVRTVTATINNGVINIGDLEVGEEATITATYVVSENDMSESNNTITNSVTLKSDNDETDKNEDSTNVITKSWKADITLNKTTSNNVNNGIVKYGEKITYVLSAKNEGNAPGKAMLKDSDLKGLIDSSKISSTVENITVNSFDTDGNPTTDLSKTVQDIVNGIEVYVPAKEGETVKEAKVTFTVTVTAKPGEKIINSLATESENKPTVISNTEKSILVNKQIATPVVTDSNVVIVLDLSGSMNDKMPNTNTTRLEAAKDACNNLIDSMFKDSNSKCAVSIVTFSAGEDYAWWDIFQLFGKGTDNAKCIGTATNSTEATNLKSKVNNLRADGGTRIAHGLSVAKTQIENLSAKNSDNKNIVVVLSDGTFNINRDGDTLESSAGEKKSRVQQYAKALKESDAKPTVYSIAFGTSETAIMRDIIASNPSTTYIPSGDSYDDLIKAFRTITDDIQGSAHERTTLSGKIYLEDIDTSKNVTIRIKSSEGTLLNTINDTIDNINQIKSDDSGYYLNAALFDADCIIELDYIAQ